MITYILRGFSVLCWTWALFCFIRMAQTLYYHKKTKEASDLTWEQAPTMHDRQWLIRKCKHFDETTELLSRLSPFKSWKIFPFTKEEKEFLFTPMGDDYGL